MTDHKRLAGQVAIVTGAGRGIGAAIARSLAAMGARLVLAGRSREPLENTAGGIENAGGAAEVVACDVTRLATVESLASHVQQAYGRADILVNNAGISGPRGPMLELSPEGWDDVLNTNLRGVYYCIRTFAPMMIRARRGDIINISSLAGKNPVPNLAAYAASKWGLNGLTYAVAEELRAHNIRVSVICPGSVDTDFGHGSRNTSKMLKAEDVAHIVEMLVTQNGQSFASEVLLRPTQKP